MHKNNEAKCPKTKCIYKCGNTGYKHYWIKDTVIALK